MGPCLVLLHKGWKVDRGPVQCRKRRSNLMGDFKKINEWEGERESFWLMRNALRRDEKLPGVFYWEVYDTLDDGGGGKEEELDGGLALALVPVDLGTGEEAEAFFDTGRSATFGDGLFSDFEQSGHEEPGLCGSSPQEDYQPFSEVSPGQGANYERENVSEVEIHGAQEGWKRKRDAVDRGRETADLQDQLLEAVERKRQVVELSV